MTTILVIEDEKTVRESLVDCLEVEGFQVLAAPDGRSGLAMAQQQNPDLILCDVQMPEVDGFTVLRQMRQSPERSATPFIFLTARTTKADLRRGMELGADDYLFKPFTIDELLGAISARLDKYAALTQQHPTIEESLAPLPNHDGLLNYFYQELRNPLSSLNLVIHLLKQPDCDVEGLVAEPDYARELAILQQIAQLRDRLTPESAKLISGCDFSKMRSPQQRSAA